MNHESLKLESLEAAVYTAETAAERLRWARATLKAVGAIEEACTKVLKEHIPVGATAHGWKHVQCFRSDWAENTPPEVLKHAEALAADLAAIGTRWKTAKVAAHTQIR